MQHEVLRAERAELLRLRNGGEINDEVMRRVERDLEETRLEIREARGLFLGTFGKETGRG